MFESTKETWGRNDVEVIVFNSKKWLNETNIKDQLKQLKFSSFYIKISSKV